MEKARSLKAEQARLTSELRAQGKTRVEISEELQRRYRVNARLALRLAHGWSQREVADAWNARWPEDTRTFKNISTWEVWPSPTGHAPSLETLDRLAQIYGCAVADLLADRPDYGQPTKSPRKGGSSIEGKASESPTAVPSDQTGLATRPLPTAGVPGREAPATEQWQRSHLTYSNVPFSLLDLASSFLTTCVDEYEATGPAVLLPHVLAQRRWVHETLAGQQPPRERLALYVLAARLAALAGYMAVNLGQFPLAQAACAEAFDLAVLSEDEDLAAWVRGTQSLCAYYLGDPRRSLEFARDGQRHAGAGSQAIRLAVNGEARALGRLGDRVGVQEAVGRAFDLAATVPVPGGMSPCISFGTYSAARIAANAATAHLNVGDARVARDYAAAAADAVRDSESVWSKSLVELDVAVALVAGDQPEPEEAAVMGLHAWRLAHDRPIESIRQRLEGLVRQTARWRTTTPAVAELAELSRTLVFATPA